MTETVSHVALRRIGDSLSLYCALGGISFSIDERNCLIIHAAALFCKRVCNERCG